MATFELRVSVYQADGLLAADSNGFSDPFLRATIGGQSRRTTYKACTLAPRWYESLVFGQLELPTDLRLAPELVLNMCVTHWAL